MQRTCRYFRSEKCKPEALPNDLWIVARSGGQIFDGCMLTVRKLVKPSLGPDNRFYQFRIGFRFGWRKLNLHFVFRLGRPWDFNRAFVACSHLLK